MSEFLKTVVEINLINYLIRLQLQNWSSEFLMIPYDGLALLSPETIFPKT